MEFIKLTYDDGDVFHLKADMIMAVYQKENVSKIRWGLAGNSYTDTCVEKPHVVMAKIRAASKRRVDEGKKQH